MAWLGAIQEQALARLIHDFRLPALVAPHILRFRQDVAAHGRVDLGAAGARRQSERRDIQGVELKRNSDAAHDPSEDTVRHIRGGRNR